ncbi:putative penicillin-binding protein [Microdochium bolleyi]|uniref:Putative penicillin-binding protein n=1 Tax=Microdochium bolleyi TaxID=196109 RepID=A0A136IXI8_9PEZI|nr:putative penicillin-binding protein [Microdochium bolleyi]
MGNNHQKNPLTSAHFVELVRAGLEEWHVPGISIAVVDGGDVWADGFGYATLPSRSGGIPATADTLYYAGSTTKAFTAAVLGQMIHPGKYKARFPLGWRTPIARVIRDDFVLSDEWATAHVTFEDALSHRTGLARHDKALAQCYPDEDAGGGRHAGTVRDFTRSLRHLPLVQEPRVEFRYCNLMFLAASRAIEAVTGNRWVGDVMREWIWKPLGMERTFLSVQDAQRAGGLAEGYYWDYSASGAEGEEKNEKHGYHYIPPMDLSGGSGAGGIVSSVADYALWLQCLLRESPPLSRACHNAIKTPRMVMQISLDGGSSSETGGRNDGYDGPLTYALGWWTGTYRGHRFYTHGGGMEAYGTELYFFPGLGYGVVTMANTAATSNCLGAVLAWQLIDDRLGVPKEERFDWTGRYKESIATALRKPDTAMDDYFPHRAQPPLPRALPTQQYTGTYYHPAYQNMVIFRNDGGSKEQRQAATGDSDRDSRPRRELYAAHNNRVWRMDFELEHVSGEHWLVYIDFTNTPNRLMCQFAKAEFKIASDGRVEGVHVEYLEDGTEGVIEYKKIE